MTHQAIAPAFQLATPSVWMFWLIAVGSAASSLPALAAQIEMPESGGKPQAIPETPREREGGVWQVWVADHGYRPRKRWSERAAPVGFRQLAFLEQFYVLSRYQGADGDFVLLAAGDMDDLQAVGWVRKDCTVDIPVRGFDDQGDGGREQFLPARRLNHRVLLFGRAYAPIGVLDGPRRHGQPQYELRDFSILFAYAETHHRQFGIAEPDYILVGTAPVVAPGREASDVLLGWVPSTEAGQWKTRQGVEWDRSSTLPTAAVRRTMPGRIYANPAKARAALDATLDQAATGGGPRARDDDIADLRERFNPEGVSPRRSPTAMCFPVLEWKPDDLLMPDGKYLPRLYRGNELIKVGTYAEPFQAGYVWRYSPAARGVPQVRVRLLLEAEAVENLLEYCDLIVEGLRTKRDPKAVGKLLSKLVQRVSGKSAKPELSCEQQVLANWGLTARSPLLKRPIGADFTQRLCLTEVIEISHRLDRLRDMLSGRQRSWRREQQNVDGFTLPKYVAFGKPEFLDRSFILPGSRSKCYWVNANTELP